MPRQTSAVNPLARKASDAAYARAIQRTRRRARIARSASIRSGVVKGRP